MSIGTDGATYYRGDDEKLHKYEWDPSNKRATGWPEREGPSNLVLTTTTLTASPNPFTQQLRLKVELDASATVTVDLLDIQGRVVATPAPTGIQEKGIQTFEVATSNLPAGMYFARLRQGEQRQTVKVN